MSEFRTDQIEESKNVATNSTGESTTILGSNQAVSEKGSECSVENIPQYKIDFFSDDNDLILKAIKSFRKLLAIGLPQYLVVSLRLIRLC
jgi:hypothetical protein